MPQRLRILAGLAALGAVLNVLVAWGSAVALDLGRSNVLELYADLGDDLHWEVYRWDNLAGTRIFSKCWSGLAVGPYNDGDPADLLESWGQIEAIDAEAPRRGAWIDEAWGFPLRSMACYTQAEPEPDGSLRTSNHHLMRLRDSRSAGDRGIHLPLMPCWWGFLVNTVLYALAVVAIHAVARDMVRAARRRRIAAVA